MRGDKSAAKKDLAGLVSSTRAQKIAKQRDQREPGDFPVLPENWPAVVVFLACSDQWQVSTSGHVLGLRNEAVDVEIRHGGHEITPDDWRRLKTLSRVVANELNKKD